MAVITQDRPIETLREQVIDQLIMNYSHGEISLEAFERRLDTATETHSHQTLIELTADLELTVDNSYVNNKKQDFAVNYVAGDTAEQDYLINIFSGSDRAGAWHVAKELRSVSICSGGTIDFTEAKFSHPTVVLKLFSLFSGDTIYVPENIRIISRAFCIFGSINNKAPSCTDPNAPTIIIEGIAIFSGIGIKIKESLKDRLMRFANGLKQLLG